MHRLLFVAMLSMAFLTGCEEGRVHGVVSSAGAEAVVSPAPTPTYSKRQLEEWHDVVISDIRVLAREVRMKDIPLDLPSEVLALEDCIRRVVDMRGHGSQGQAA